MELSYFLSNSNKKIIWDLLVDSNYFEDFPSKSKNDVRIIFDQTLNNIFDSKTSDDNLIDLNKKAVQNMILKRNAILRKEREIFQTQDSFNSNININSSDSIGPIQQIYQRPQIKETNRVTAEDMRQLREMEFSRTLQTKQNEFNQLINSDKPKDIDFSDKLDDQRIGDNMENLLAQVKAQREKELGITYSDQSIENADKFIKNGHESKPKRLIIDSSEDYNNNSVTKLDNSKKQVRFNEKNNENITFFVNDNDDNANDNKFEIKPETIIENKNNNQILLDNTNNSIISTSNFLTKLKTKKSFDNSQTNITNINDIIELKNEISNLKNLHFESLDILKNLSIQIIELFTIVKNIDNEINKNKFESFDNNENDSI